MPNYAVIRSVGVGLDSEVINVIVADSLEIANEVIQRSAEHVTDYVDAFCVLMPDEKSIGIGSKYINNIIMPIPPKETHPTE
jgi:hypothetical protein